MTVIVLIRRVAKAECVDDFIKQYMKERCVGGDGFITEYLTRVEGAEIPGLRELGLMHPSKDGVAFLNVAFWDSKEQFQKAYEPKPDSFDPETECEPRKRAVLEIKEMAGKLPPRVTN